MRHFAKLLLATSFILGLTGVARAWDDFAPPSDSEIGHIILTANKAEIDAGNLAVEKAQNQGLKDFAQLLVKEHTASNLVINVLFVKIRITPADNDISKGFSKNTTDRLNQIKALSGNDFDKAWINWQVQVHSQVLTSLDQQLIPAAQNGELKEFLQKYRNSINDHLQKAQQLAGQIH